MVLALVRWVRVRSRWRGYGVWVLGYGRTQAMVQAAARQDACVWPRPIPHTPYPRQRRLNLNPPRGNGSANAYTQPMSSSAEDFLTKSPQRPAPGTTDAPDPVAYAKEIGLLLKDRHCENIVALDVRGISPLTQVVIVASGTSDRQIKALAAEVGEEAAAAGFPAFRRRQRRRQHLGRARPGRHHGAPVRARDPGALRPGDALG